MAADAVEPVAALSRAARAAGVTIDVLIDVDIGLGRCGVGSAEEAVELADAIATLPGLRLAGLMGYEGRVRLGTDGREARIAAGYAVLADVRIALERHGHPVSVVSGGGTSTLSEALASPVLTEVQAGVYALMEPELLPMELPFTCAASIRGTVISRHPGRVVLGHRAPVGGPRVRSPRAAGVHRPADRGE